jgi:lipopolysaccharide/colanic/teichoic acid biosynthesis glycosyltransferase
MKRATDIVGSLVGIVISAPIILLLALLIRLESKGPVWIRQKRVGRNGKSFWIYKLRSMKAGVEEDPHSWAANDDPRCTRLGKWIRKFSLDELPQFWCVLKGDMSLVGPRPEMAELVAKFCESVHSYGLRFRMKPGMTGWAAIHGFRGNTSLQERIDYDMYYIQNWSWLGDLKILVVTLFRLKSTILFLNMANLLRMLIVNHHGALGNVVGQLAKQSGWEVLIVERKDALLKMINEKTMDLVVCDSTIAQEKLEITSRTELVEAMRSAGLKAPIFLFEDEGVEVKMDPEVMKGLGGVRIFRKPVSIAEMREAIHEVGQKIESSKKGKA